MPIDFVPTNLHRREQKTIAKMPPAAQGLGRTLDRRGVSSRTIQQQPAIVRPKLDIAGHRLAVQPQIVGGRAEQHVRHAVFAVGHGQFILVPKQLGPSGSSGDTCSAAATFPGRAGDGRDAARASSLPAAPADCRDARAAGTGAAAESAWPGAIRAASKGTAAHPKKPNCREMAADGVLRPGKPGGSPQADCRKVGTSADIAPREPLLVG